MNGSLLGQHLFRAWRKHWALQMASVTVMTLVLMMLNGLFFGYTAFNRTVDQWGKGLEMSVYIKEGAEPGAVEGLERQVRESGEFDQVHFTPKTEATKKFLTALGPESLELLSDPKWSSPIPASFDLRLSDQVPTGNRVNVMQTWSARLRGLDFVEDVFYGQGWVENFSSFLGGARGVVAMCWVLALCVGLLIVSNCIRLSFLQRRDEIEILELVGATSRFIRVPFLLEGVVLGAVASVCSLLLSYGLHALLLGWLGDKWNFWFALQNLAPLQAWYIAANLASGIAFGALGAWNCVRKLNTGWSAAAG
jgi:cell division transport system permease protein